MLAEIFPIPKPVIGMIHVVALPGTPAGTLSLAEVVALAAREARAYRHGGANGDVKKKHSAHAITADVTLGLTAEPVEFMLGDAVIVTGSVTGDPCQVEDVHEERAHCRLPVALGSGVTADNLSRFFGLADGFIIGTHFKVDGRWTGTVDPKRIEAFMAAAARLKSAPAE